MKCLSHSVGRIAACSLVFMLPLSAFALEVLSKPLCEGEPTPAAGRFDWLLGKLGMGGMPSGMRGLAAAN